MLEALDLYEEWLPPAHECTAIGAAGDQAAGALGVGVDRPGPLSVVLGTSGVVFAALPEYKPEPEARLHVFCHAVPGTWHAMGVMLSAAGSLQWLHDALGNPPYEELLAEAEKWEPGTEGLLFQPYLQGERTPHADPDARGAFVGLTLRHDRGALTRAVLEGVAYGLRDSLELLRELGVEAQVGRVSGGGARERALAEDRRLGARPAARADERGRGRRLRRGAARRRRAGRFRRRARGGRRLRPRLRPDRARPRLAGRVRRGLRALPRALPGPSLAGGLGLSIFGERGRSPRS